MYTLIRVLDTIRYLLTCVLVLLMSLTINIQFRIYWQLFIYYLFVFIKLVVDHLSQSSSACCCQTSLMRNIYSRSFLYLFKAATCTACYDWFKAWVTCGFVFFFSFSILYRQRIRCIMNKFSNNPIQLHVLARKSKGNLHNAKWSWIGYLCR